MHSLPILFRATGITNFLENGGTLEVAQRIAGHADSRTTKLYDRRGQKVFDNATSTHSSVAGALSIPRLIRGHGADSVLMKRVDTVGSVVSTRKLSAWQNPTKPSLIDRDKEYTYIYSPFSSVSHGSDMWKSIVVGDQDLQMNPIREPQNVPQVAQLAATLTLRVLQMLIKEYRAGEEENFKRKYEQEWRTPFLKGYNVEIFPHDLTI